MSRISAEQQHAIATLMRRYDGRVPGASLLVLRGGEAIVREARGLADVDGALAATPRTRYRLASISKQFTASAILLLAEDGRLSLDDGIRQWLPGLPPVADGITLHHLLAHTSGLVDYEDVMTPSPGRQLHDADVLRLLEAQQRLRFAPGSDYRYNNGSYVLLGRIVGLASGLDFPEFLQRRVFARLGMDDSVVPAPGASGGGTPMLAHRAYGHSLIDGRWQRTDQDATSATLGDGGIYSSIDDLARWDAALYDERLLSRESLRLMFSPHTRTPEPDVDFYGYGWRLHGGLRWHSGESIGFRNVFLRYPEQGLSVLLLSNRNDPEPYRTARSIAAVFGG